jgi:hypothetical protein
MFNDYLREIKVLNTFCKVCLCFFLKYYSNRIIKKKLKIRLHNKMTQYCSPLVEPNGKKGGSNLLSIKKTIIKPVVPTSCLSLSVVKELVRAWNNRNLEDKINLDQPAQSLYRELKSKFETTDEISWFENDIIKSVLDESKIDEVRKKYFKPLAPKSWHSEPEQWLSNFDIEKVLEQYETKYPEFKTYGALPIDFALKSGDSCQISSLCAISLEALMKQNKKYIGIVFNLDKHTESGSHWVALFVNIPAGEINFWDSVAKSAPQEVEDLMSKLHKQLTLIKEKKTQLYSKCGCTYQKPMKQYNKIRHQYANSECGMYSLYFIIEQLDNGKKFNQVCRNVVNDSKMNAMRKEYFIIKSVDNKSKSLFGKLFS